MISIVLYGIAGLLVIVIIVRIAKTGKIDIGDLIALLAIVVSIILALGTPLPNVLKQSASSPTNSPQQTINSTEIPVAISTSWIDNFDDATLNSRWAWIGENPTHWNLTARPGFMRITLTTNSSIGGTPTNELIISMPTTDFTIETRVIFSPTQMNQFAGLLILQDGDNHLKLGHAVYSNEYGGNAIYFDKKENGEFAVNDFPTKFPGQDNIYIKIERRGSVYTGYASEDGKSWTLLGSQSIQFNPHYIGLFVADGERNAPEIPADFDYFSLK